MQSSYTEKGAISWFARNSVASNLLMFCILFAGFLSFNSIKKSMFPDFETDTISVSVPYLGAAPEEVEEGVCIKIEEAIKEIEGLKKVTSTANEGLGQVIIEVSDGYDIDQVLDEIKLKVDAIATFPALTEKPVIAKAEFQSPVIWVSVGGNLTEIGRKIFTEEIRDELLALPDVDFAKIQGDKNFEISIEVSETNLQKYNLSIEQISQAIRTASVDLPGGTIKTDDGNILLRTKGQAYSGEDFKNLVIRTNPDGTRLKLADIATIIDGFEETNDYSRFDGEPNSSIQISAVGDQSEIAIADAVRAYIDKKKENLPEGVILEYWGDTSFYLKGRLNMMIENLVVGGFLVFLILTLFLRLRVALWVIIGIPISFLGAFWLMPHEPFNTSINVVSLFGFILVLGIVVDDAIIIGESIYSEVEKHGASIDNIIIGTKKVATPATFGVLTTIAAFAPMLFISGRSSAFLVSIASVVILSLIFSLIESKFILPAHLAHAGLQKKSRPSPLLRLQNKIAQQLDKFIHHVYKPWLDRALRHKGVTLSLFIGVFFMTIGLLAGGVVRFIFFPEVPSDFIRTNLVLNEGASPKERDQLLSHLEDTLNRIDEEYQQNNPGEKLVKHIQLYTQGDTRGDLVVELTKTERRSMNTHDLETQWRESIGELAGVRELVFSASSNPGGDSAISFKLSGKNNTQLEAATDELLTYLNNYEGLLDIRDTLSKGAAEIQLQIKPEAQALGLTLNDLGRQVRQAFYGEEAQRIQRGSEDIRVMVRYPKEERSSVDFLENMKIRTPNGDEVPFYDVAIINQQQGYSSINRVDGSRAVTVSAGVNYDITQPNIVVADITDNFIKELNSEYPNVTFELEGSSKEQQKSLQQMGIAAIVALFLIYALLAIPLKSYAQPLIIMSVIPFGFIGAVAGHWVLGMSVNMFSIFGIIALAGVVVNDSLIMVEFVNRAKQAGKPINQAILDAGAQRFRAILLTSLTTFFGLVPILLETSLQAKFVQPMALSLSAGILFATVITLFLIPTLYLVGYDIKAKWRKNELPANANNEKLNYQS